MEQIAILLSAMGVMLGLIGLVVWISWRLAHRGP